MLYRHVSTSNSYKLMLSLMSSKEYYFKHMSRSIKKFMLVFPNINSLVS